MVGPVIDSFPKFASKKSVDDWVLCGYIGYFTDKISVNLSRDYLVELWDMPPRARKVIPHRTFKQIRLNFIQK